MESCCCSKQIFLLTSNAVIDGFTAKVPMPHVIPPNRLQVHTRHVFILSLHVINTEAI